MKSLVQDQIKSFYRIKPAFTPARGAEVETFAQSRQTRAGRSSHLARPLAPAGPPPTGSSQPVFSFLKVTFPPTHFLKRKKSVFKPDATSSSQEGESQFALKVRPGHRQSSHLLRRSAHPPAEKPPLPGPGARTPRPPPHSSAQRASPSARGSRRPEH